MILELRFRDLIEPYWNVKVIFQPPADLTTAGFNRTILECKDLQNWSKLRFESAI